ncbi:hypothetical protein [Ktedonospora formicarum]|uniref:Uncharacterized protein n=1 Tax=Ktedonospora formicarum TaxID=2778364 RepID=A0A8J3I7J4_9CHLR|nr:hypothetical protein [Ktedonospora formicarum]GHO48548.1 hypothetical protein KSX_67110 [Ktedonospora formicarum]
MLLPYDPSCDACAATLYVSFCRVYGLEPVGLFRQAYPPTPGERLIDPPFPLLERLARWEGISMPSVWDRTHFHHLVRLLATTLVTCLTQTPIGKRLR